MSVFGTESQTLRLGEQRLQSCPTCRRQRSFEYCFRYRSVHVFWMLGLVTRATYLLVCGSCVRETEIPRAEVPVDALRRIDSREVPPLFRRFGRLTVIILGGAGSVVGRLPRDEGRPSRS